MGQHPLRPGQRRRTGRGAAGRVALRSHRGQVLDGQVLRTELRADAVTEELLAKVSFKAVPQPLPPIGERAEVTVDLPAPARGAGDS